jgi:hypothetical protein
MFSAGPRACAKKIDSRFEIAAAGFSWEDEPDISLPSLP